MGILEVKDVNKRFGGLKALSEVNLSVVENTVHAIHKMTGVIEQARKGLAALKGLGVIDDG